MTKKKKLIILIAAVCLLAAAVTAVLCIFVFSEDTPAKLFKSIERNDVESITGVSYPEGSHGELKGDDIDKFIQIIRGADNKPTDRTGHEIVGGDGPYFTVKLKNGKEYMIHVFSGYTYKGTKYKGFIRVDDDPWYECDTRDLQKLFFINSDSQYKEYYQTH